MPSVGLSAQISDFARLGEISGLDKAGLGWPLAATSPGRFSRPCMQAPGGPPRTRPAREDRAGLARRLAPSLALLAAVAERGLEQVLVALLQARLLPLQLLARREQLAIEVVQRRCVPRRDVLPAQLLAPHRAVLALHQRVVVAVPRARLGEALHAQFLKQPRELVVDVLRPVVGMQPVDHAREGAQHSLQQRPQRVLGNPLHAADELDLRHLVHHVDAIDTLNFILVPSVRGGHPQPTRLPARRGSLALRDRDCRRARGRPPIRCRQLLVLRKFYRCRSRAPPDARSARLRRPSKCT